MSLPYFFLLGGYDLEMQTIRSLLEAQGYVENIDFLDKRLSWGACLSAYQAAFHPTRTNVGIELAEDIAPPTNYLRIDHHNEWAHLPASIEQVAKLLGSALTREQQLVAANDQGYIPAMEAMGATADEIADIRRQDRAAQGVTEQDEALAEQSIAENLMVKNGITVVRSLTSKFSPITDRLYGKTNNRLLVYTNDALTYYGVGKTKLEQQFQHLIKENKAYAGGGEHGFFGIAYQALPAPMLSELVDNIPNLVHGD